jgi:hypothetical protein
MYVYFALGPTSSKKIIFYKKKKWTQRRLHIYKLEKDERAKRKKTTTTKTFLNAASFRLGPSEPPAAVLPAGVGHWQSPLQPRHWAVST